MKTYREIMEKLEEITEGYSGLKLGKSLTRNEFNQKVGTKITAEDWNKTTNWAGNEYV